MATYKSPGVYIEEIQVFPPSVAQVETAIPAFIGYTEKTEYNGQDIKFKPIKIKSLLEYVEIFGGGFPDEDEEYITVTFKSDSSIDTVAFEPKYYLYDSIRLFYANGGGFCYVVAVNSYRDSQGNQNNVNKDELNDGIETIKKEDEPTLIVVPDSVLLDQDSLASSVHTKALDQCAELGDRFAILDIRQGNKKIDLNLDPVANFRNAGSANNLKYGATYYPWVRTTLSFNFKFKNIKFKNHSGADTDLATILNQVAQPASIINQLTNVTMDLKKFSAKYAAGVNGNFFQKEYSSITGVGITSLRERAKYVVDAIKAFIDWNSSDPFLDNDASDIIDEETVTEIFLKNTNDTSGLAGIFQSLQDIQGTYEGSKLDISFADTFHNDTGDPEENKLQTIKSVINEVGVIFNSYLDYVLKFKGKIKSRAENLELLLEQQTPLYSGIVKRIKEQGIVLPPSGAIAGICAKVDSTRGVWKAPANISINEVSGPTVKIDNAEQDSLNIDVNSGKSVNAIRSFTGKGTMVWGARTLAGNDNEWRYISVRRFFNMVEESVKKSTSWAVFEPNDANTWIRVKSMIENYLTLLWRQGALAGSTTDAAFFVKVGLGITMTAQDILEGRMNVEIGMAAVRPAEFIILKFSHKMQEA